MEPTNRNHVLVSTAASNLSDHNDDGSYDNYDNKYIIVNVTQQQLYLYVKNAKNAKNAKNNRIKKADRLIRTYMVSTAKNGVGSQEGSNCTPLGGHTIAKKIGDNAPMNSVFVGRVLTGEIYSEQLGTQYPKRDWILSRILWLSGCEEGANKGFNSDTGKSCDTFNRYIYIHGTPDTEPMGTPLSHGCIRMRTEDIIELYDLVAEGTPVQIIQG